MDLVGQLSPLYDIFHIKEGTTILKVLITHTAMFWESAVPFKKPMDSLVFLVWHYFRRV